jgi:hypothetical protein
MAKVLFEFSSSSICNLPDSILYSSTSSFFSVISFFLLVILILFSAEDDVNWFDCPAVPDLCVPDCSPPSMSTICAGRVDGPALPVVHGPGAGGLALGAEEQACLSVDGVVGPDEQVLDEQIDKHSAGSPLCDEVVVLVYNVLPLQRTSRR